MRLLLPSPPDLPRLHAVDVFRGMRVLPGALPSRVLLDQAIRSGGSSELAYRWSVPLLIALPGPSLIVGTIGGKGLLDGEDEVELAYNVVEEHRGKGVATQAIDIIQWVAKRDGLQLVAHTELDNEPSRRALRKNGFICESIIRLPDSLDLERWHWSPD